MNNKFDLESAEAKTDRRIHILKQRFLMRLVFSNRLADSALYLATTQTQLMQRKGDLW